MSGEVRLEDAFPLPWRLEETWTGSLILDANSNRVFKLSRGQSEQRIIEEKLLADWIVRCVNSAGASEIERWWAEMAAEASA